MKVNPYCARMLQWDQRLLIKINIIKNILLVIMMWLHKDNHKIILLMIMMRLHKDNDKIILMIMMGLHKDEIILLLIMIWLHKDNDKIILMIMMWLHLERVCSRASGWSTPIELYSSSPSTLSPRHLLNYQLDHKQ